MARCVKDVLPFSGAEEAVSRQYFSDVLCPTWKRPSEGLSTLDPASTSLAVFQCDVTSTNAVPSSDILELYPTVEKDWASQAVKADGAVPLIQIFGCTAQSNSVLLNVWGKYPYLYFYCPPSLAQFENALKTAFEDQLRASPQGKTCAQRVLRVDFLRKKSLLHYTGDSTSLFGRATLALPQLVAPLRSAIENGMRVSVDGTTVSLPTSVFEANIPFELRFMVDTGMSGCCWVEAPQTKYRLRPEAQKTSHCQIEADIFVDDMVAHASDTYQWQTIPPLRILSFDIECVTETGRGFPVPQTDKVIQIATVLMEHGQSDAHFRAVFTLNSCTGIPGATVCWFDSEKEMLLRWRDLLIACDPDIITGYNCVNFDLNYLLLRASTLRLDGFSQLARLKAIRSRIRDTVLSSRGMGTHENKAINTEGRVQMDMLEVIRRDYKLKSYTLNAVSAHFLKEQKEDVPYSMLGELFRGTAETRRRVATYCLKDALLPSRLMNKLLVIVNYVEMARVTGTPLNFLLTRMRVKRCVFGWLIRGQQIKVTSQLLRKCRELGYLFPSIRTQGRGADDREKAYEGATVLDPLKGLYKMPIATLDFASLYPSIMMAHNLCYSTLVTEPLDSVGLTVDDITKTPSHTTFVKSSKRKGVLPLIVEELIAARKRAKKEMEAETDETRRMVLNGRQLALKLSANSVYGYTGAITGGQLPCIEVSTAITAYGREMIDFTKTTVETLYRKENGYACDATVVYGDTDSVMVLFGVPDIAEAMRLGREAAEAVTQRFVRPIKLEFEKVFCPFLLMNKKRYAGLLYTSPDAYSRIDCKGIETVRRDFCLLVQQVVDTVLKKLLIDQDEEAAKEYTRHTISQLLQNNIDLSLLVLSKSLGKEDYTSKLAHVELAKKLRQRDPGNAPQIGDRVHFVIISGTKGQAQYDRAEDPLYVLEKNLTVDTQYYLDNIKNPLLRIFEGVMNNPESLFVGTHTYKKKVLTSSSGALSKFVRTSLQCLGCRSTIPSGALCRHCYKERQRETSETKKINFPDCGLNANGKIVYGRSGIFKCYCCPICSCQGSLGQEILCTSRDCPIFYRRTKVRKDIDEIQRQVDRLSIEW